MKKLLSTSLLSLALFSFGCSTQTAIQEDPLKDHMGCQEDEIDENGECIVAEENNRMLFEKDLSDSVVSEEISSEVMGYFAQPKQEGDYPGVIMIHEWWGLNDNIKYMAELLASEGYRVFAVDLYDGKVAEDSTAAREYATAVRSNPDEAISKMQAASDYLKEEAGATSIASLGWCFGGQQSLNFSVAEDLDATVIYYGNLTEDEEQLASLNSPVLGIFGAEDGGIPVESVENFEASLNNLGVKNEITIYPGVGHAFANPSGDNYAAKETLNAWQKTLEFLEANL